MKAWVGWLVAAVLGVLGFAAAFFRRAPSADRTLEAEKRAGEAERKVKAERVKNEHILAEQAINDRFATREGEGYPTQRELDRLLKAARKSREGPK